MIIKITIFNIIIIFFFFLLVPVSLSDPRISESVLLCGNDKAKPSNFIPIFVKEMEILSQLIAATATTTHFATHNINLNKTSQQQQIPIYALAQCHRDLSQTDCLLCFAASRTKLPRCLPSLSARIFLDGCFLRYDNYSFYRESVSSSLDTVKCSSENAVVSDFDGGGGGEGESAFVESVGYAVGNVSRMAVEKGGGGFGAVEVMGVYALAQCWESVGRDGCEECLKKAATGVKKNCRMKKEGRGLNAGCYLRYSTDKFFNDGGGESEDHHHGNIYV